LHAARTPEPFFVALTADVDPDANRPEAGRIGAASAGGPDGAIRLDACFEGLSIALATLHDAGLPATLFYESRTLRELASREPGLLRGATDDRAFEHGCHGYCHEDFAGKVSGLPISAAEAKAIMVRADEAFASVMGAPPRAFRAPYCRVTPALAHALAEEGYAYDASLTQRPSAAWRLRPYRLPDAPTVWELALCRSNDKQGRPISCYLWQLFEGNRPVQDYVDLVRSVRRTCPGGLLQIAFHPWHLIVSQDGGRLPSRAGGTGPSLFRQFVEQAAQLSGLEFTTCGAYLKRAVETGAS